MTAYRELERHADVLERRRESGFVRQCHGDLHLRNIVLLDGRPTLFDAVEFNDEIACTDVLYDLAFLLMDLWRAAAASRQYRVGTLPARDGGRRRRLSSAALPVLPSGGPGEDERDRGDAPGRRATPAGAGGTARAVPGAWPTRSCIRRGLVSWRSVGSPVRGSRRSRSRSRRRSVPCRARSSCAATRRESACAVCLSSSVSVPRATARR